jgi:CheY-like chemotaxis protein
VTHSTLRVLIVDDNRDGADSLLLILQASGHDARVAYDGESGLRLAREFRPDVVLLNLGMPGLDGFEVARRLRRDGGPHHPLLVALPAWDDEEARRRTAETGFDAHQLKPADLGLLQRLLADAAARLALAGAA